MPERFQNYAVYAHKAAHRRATLPAEESPPAQWAHQSEPPSRLVLVSTRHLNKAVKVNKVVIAAPHVVDHCVLPTCLKTDGTVVFSFSQAALGHCGVSQRPPPPRPLSTLA
jgi:hypothetical protein